MKFLVYGSVNLDFVYELDHIVQPGETITVKRFSSHFGGKGANQAAALARAGMPVALAGKVGPDGRPELDKLAEFGADVSNVTVDPGSVTGQGIIQLASDGENAICVFPGANREITRSEMEAVLEKFAPGDLLLLQNEINDLAFLIEAAAGRKLEVAINPAPFTPELLALPLEKVSVLFVNQVEASQLTGLAEHAGSDALLDALTAKLPACEIVLTLGSRGAAWAHNGNRRTVPALKVKAVDTTGAGDTFIGYFLSGRARGFAPEACLALGCRAAALAVTRLGAMESIPAITELS